MASYHSRITTLINKTSVVYLIFLLYVRKFNLKSGFPYFFIKNQIIFGPLKLTGNTSRIKYNNSYNRC